MFCHISDNTWVRCFFMILFLQTRSPWRTVRMVKHPIEPWLSAVQVIQRWRICISKHINNINHQGPIISPKQLKIHDREKQYIYIYQFWEIVNYEFIIKRPAVVRYIHSMKSIPLCVLLVTDMLPALKKKVYDLGQQISADWPTRFYGVERLYGKRTGLFWPELAIFVIYRGFYAYSDQTNLCIFQFCKT